MSNSLTPLITAVLARGLSVLRKRVLMTRVVNLDYSKEAAKFTDTINVPYSSAKTATDVAPSHVPSAPADSTAQSVAIQLNKWKKVNFGFTDKEMAEFNAKKDYIPLEMQEAFEAMAVAINQSVFALYTSVYGFTGSPGSTPFADDVTDATNARKILQLQKAPRTGRTGVLDFNAEANALALAQFSDAEKIGASGVKIDGEIGRKFGINWMADDDVPYHTAGSITTGLSAKTSTDQAVGTKNVVCTTAASTGACDLKKGDIITFAGDTQTYVVTADTAEGDPATDVTVPIEPGLKVALSGDEAVTLESSHRVNLAFHRDCFALAMRAPSMGLKQVENQRNQVVLSDPHSGLVMRLEIMDQYKQTTWEIDAMWGCACIRPEFGTRLAG